MVTITNFTMIESNDGNTYISLEIQGGIEIIQSQKNDNYYTTIRKCNIITNLDEITAKFLVGKQISGKIIKEACNAYKYTIKESGEVVTLSHRYVFSSEENEIQTSTKSSKTRTSYKTLPDNRLYIKS